MQSTFSFIGLAERYDESMVMLASMLRLPLSQAAHILHMRMHLASGTCTMRMHMHAQVSICAGGARARAAVHTM